MSRTEAILLDLMVAHPKLTLESVLLYLIMDSDRWGIAGWLASEEVAKIARNWKRAA